jgi:hypothetical protein
MTSRLALAVLVALTLAAAGYAVPVELSGNYILVRSNASDQNWLELRTFPDNTVRALTPRPASGERRRECCARFSPDGSKVAFTRSTRRVSKLLLLDLQTGTLRTLFQRPVGPLGLRYVWSLDSGSLLQWTWSQSGGTVRRLFPDGTGPTVVSEFRTQSGLTWGEGTSPDGSVALVVESHGDPFYFRYEGPDVLYAVGGGRKVELARTDSLGEAEWSPDGTLVAYTADCYSICRLEVVRSNGTGRRALTRFRTKTSGVGGFDELFFAWAGRRGEIVYARGLTLYGIDVLSGSQRRIRTLPCPRRRCESPQISILAVSQEKDTAFVQVADYGEELQDASLEFAYRTYRVSLLTGAVAPAERIANAVDVWFGQS